MKFHWVFNGMGQLLKAFNLSDGHVYVPFYECHGGAENDGFGFRGKCPPGIYTLGEFTPYPVADEPNAYGAGFITILDPNGYWSEYGRSGIGIHGGGSDLQFPLAPRQGWETTYGCLRLQNEDVLAFSRRYTVGEKLTVAWAS